MIDVWIATGLCLVFCCLFYYLGWVRGVNRTALAAYTKGVNDAVELVTREINKMIEKEGSDGE